jgi:hypothetical protein
LICSWVSGAGREAGKAGVVAGTGLWAGPGGPGYLVKPSSLFAAMAYWLV